MKIEYLHKEEYWDVELDWAPPVKWTGGRIQLAREADSNYGLYRFDREHSLQKGSRELTYIGIAYDQTIGVRVRQHPVDEVRGWKRKGDLWISYAIFNVDGSERRIRYEDVEHILTYFYKPEEADKKTKSVPKGCYWITNTGCKGSLPKKIVYPVAETIK